MAINPDWGKMYFYHWKNGGYSRQRPVSLPEITNEMFGEAMWFALKDDDFGRYHWPQHVDGLMSMVRVGVRGGSTQQGVPTTGKLALFWDEEITNLTHLGWDFLELDSSTILNLYTFCWICKKMVAKNHWIYDCTQKWRNFISIMIFST